MSSWFRLVFFGVSGSGCFVRRTVGRTRGSLVRNKLPVKTIVIGSSRVVSEKRGELVRGGSIILRTRVSTVRGTNHLSCRSCTRYALCAALSPYPVYSKTVVLCGVPGIIVNRGAALVNTRGFLRGGSIRVGMLGGLGYGRLFLRFARSGPKV